MISVLNSPTAAYVGSHWIPPNMRLNTLTGTTVIALPVSTNETTSFLFTFMHWWDLAR